MQMSLTDFAKERTVNARKQKDDAAMKELQDRFGKEVIFRGE